MHRRLHMIKQRISLEFISFGLTGRVMKRELTSKADIYNIKSVHMGTYKTGNLFVFNEVNEATNRERKKPTQRHKLQEKIETKRNIHPRHRIQWTEWLNDCPLLNWEGNPMAFTSSSPPLIPYLISIFGGVVNLKLQMNGWSQANCKRQEKKENKENGMLKRPNWNMKYLFDDFICSWNACQSHYIEFDPKNAENNFSDS